MLELILACIFAIFSVVHGQDKPVQPIFVNFNASPTPFTYSTLEFWSSNDIFPDESFSFSPQTCMTDISCQWFFPLTLDQPTNPFPQYTVPEAIFYSLRKYPEYQHLKINDLESMPCFAFHADDRITRSTPMFAGFLVNSGQQRYIDPKTGQGYTEKAGANTYYSASLIPKGWAVTCHGYTPDSTSLNILTKLTVTNSAFGSNLGITYEIGNEVVLLPIEVSTGGVDTRFVYTELQFDYQANDVVNESRIDLLTIHFLNVPINSMLKFSLIFDTASQLRIDRLYPISDVEEEELAHLWGDNIELGYSPQCTVSTPDNDVNQPSDGSPQLGKQKLKKSTIGHSARLLSSRDKTKTHRLQKNGVGYSGFVLLTGQEYDEDEELESTETDIRAESDIFSAMYLPQSFSTPTLSAPIPSAKLIHKISCTIPISIFALQQQLIPVDSGTDISVYDDESVSTTIHSISKLALNVGEWSGHNIAVYVSFLDSRLFRYETTDPKAKWDFTHPLMGRLPQLITNHLFFDRSDPVVAETNDPPQRLGTVYLQWHMIITGPYPQFEILGLQNVQPGTITLQSLFDPHLHLNSFFYTVSSHHRKDSLKIPIKTTVLTSDEIKINNPISPQLYNGYANITFSFVFEATQLVPFNLEVLVNNKPIVLKFTPSTALSTHIDLSSLSELAVTQKFSYKPSFQIVCTVFSKQNPVEIPDSLEFPFAWKKPNIRPAALAPQAVDSSKGNPWDQWEITNSLFFHLIPIVNDLRVPTDLSKPRICFIYAIDESGAEVPISKPFTYNSTASSPELTPYLGTSLSNYVVIYGISIQIGHTLVIECKYNLVPNIPKGYSSTTHDLHRLVQYVSLLTSRYSEPIYQVAITDERGFSTQSAPFHFPGRRFSPLFRKQHTNTALTTQPLHSLSNSQFTATSQTQQNKQQNPSITGKTSHILPVLALSSTPIQSPEDLDEFLSTITTIMNTAIYLPKPSPSSASPIPPTPTPQPTVLSQVKKEHWRFVLFSITDRENPLFFSHYHAFPSSDLYPPTPLPRALLHTVPPPSLQHNPPRSNQTIQPIPQKHIATTSKYPNAAALSLHLLISEAFPNEDPELFTQQFIDAHSFLPKSGVFLSAMQGVSSHRGQKVKWWGPNYYQDLSNQQHNVTSEGENEEEEEEESEFPMNIPYTNPINGAGCYFIECSHGILRDPFVADTLSLSRKAYLTNAFAVIPTDQVSFDLYFPPHDSSKWAFMKIALTVGSFVVAITLFVAIYFGFFFSNWPSGPLSKDRKLSLNVHEEGEEDEQDYTDSDEDDDNDDEYS